MGLDEVLELVSEIAVSTVAENAEETDAKAQWPERNLREIQRVGLGGLVVPTHLGGCGQGMTGLAKVCELLGRYCPSTALCFGMHCVGSAVLSAKASPEQVERFLQPICQGRHLTTLALSEPGSGSHFYFPESVLKASGTGYCLKGTKSFVTNGGCADSYVVSARAGEADAPPGQFSCLIIPGETDGIRWKEPWQGLGMRGNSSRAADFDVKVPSDLLLGAEGDQLWYIFNVIAPHFLVAMAGTYLGLARRALDAAISHLKNRSYLHSGSGLSEADVLQHRVGTMWGKLEAAAQLVYSAAGQGDQGSESATLALFSAKSEMAEVAVTIVNDSMTLMGGIAYREGSLMERLLRDVRAAHVMAPTTDLLRLWSGRMLLGQPILGDL